MMVVDMMRVLIGLWKAEPTATAIHIHSIRVVLNTITNWIDTMNVSKIAESKHDYCTY
jgi:hypothetical protein